MTELEYILKSLNNIDSHYYKVMGIISKTKYQQAAENAFTAEFYHQLKLLQKFYLKDEDLTWHFDLNKERANSIRPDLVLHKSPYNRDDQRIYIEIKTNKNTGRENIKHDLKKIINSISNNSGPEYLGFKNAFYIIGNKNKDLIIEVFKEVYDKHENDISKINIILFDSENYIPQPIDLNTIIT